MDDDPLGSRIENLLGKAKSEVYLCSPFIKEKVLRRLFKKIPKSVPVVVVTRWRPDEVALGVSDLEVFDLAKKRPKTELRLLDELHAKLYIADDSCLVGSANLTDTALGWRTRANLEILIPARHTDKPVKALLTRLEQAQIATPERREDVEKRTADLKDSVRKLREFQAEQERLQQREFQAEQEHLQQDEGRSPISGSKITGFVLDGREYQCGSAFGTLKCIAETLARDNPEFMDKFDGKTRGRIRRLVAQRRLDLHQRSRKEAEISMQLENDWWMAQKQSTEQVHKHIKAACDVADIKFGSQLTLIEQ